MNKVFFIVFAVLFAVDLCLVVSGLSQAFDNIVLTSFIDIRNNILTIIFRAITFCGETATMIVLCVALIALPSRAKIGFPVALMTGAGTAVQTLIKELVSRPRPDAAYWLVSDKDWLGFSFGYSFPSGHANTSMIFWVALAILIGRVLISKDHSRAAAALRIIFFCFALLVGLSRLYLGVHYPSDVFGGWMLAGLLLIVFFALYERFWPAKWRLT